MSILLRVVQLLLFTGLTVISLTGFGCRQNPNRTGDARENPLIVWGLWQDSAHMDPILKSFKDQTGINVEYRKIASLVDYEQQLLEALAQGRGPDVFVIHHTWVERRRGLMTPAPADIIDSRELSEQFVDVVSADVLRDNQIYALPVSVDTLALYYNKDLLSAAGIALPPRTWEDVHNTVGQVTRITRNGDIQQSAIAMGTAANINRASDIVQMLMMQSGLSILDPVSRSIDLNTAAGQQALTFYIDFSNKAKRVYSWDLQQNYSVDAFAEGETAMMLSYSYYLPVVRAKNPRLSFGIAPLPQIAGSKVVNFASYWPFAVSNSSRSPNDAWRFVYFLSGTEASAQLNRATGTPPARRDTIAQFTRDPILGVFAEQTLTATSWPRGDIVATDKIFNDMIDSIVVGRASVTDALAIAQTRLQQLLEQPQ